MKLFLASRIKNPKTIKKLDDYIGGFKGKKIALIPTASNGENEWGYWKVKEDGTWKFVHSLGAKITDVVLEDYRNDSVIKKLENQDIIWFMGGMPGYLMYWIRRCSIDLHIKRLLDNGALYVGSSAGSMVAGKTLQVSGWGFTDCERGAEEFKPLNLVDFDIFPHYEGSLLDKIKENYKGNRLYLLKNGEEIIVEDSKVSIIGEERIITK